MGAQLGAATADLVEPALGDVQQKLIRLMETKWIEVYGKNVIRKFRYNKYVNMLVYESIGQTMEMLKQRRNQEMDETHAQEEAL
jgi:NADPH-dependent 7-cyano-7-deazaguanine reductase QueF